MKTWMKVALGIFAGIAALVGFIFWLTGDVTKAGDDFFAAAQNDDMDAAYALLSEDFQNGTSKEGLRAYLAANALDNVKETSWSSREIAGSTGELEGTVTTLDGSEIPLTLRLINSEAGWRINAIVKESAGFKDSSGARLVPSVGEQQQLFRETVAAFADSLVDDSMKKLWDSSANGLRQTASVEDLDNAFKTFFDDDDAFLTMSKITPVIDSAKINEKAAILSIRGHYGFKDKSVHFEQRYIYEGTNWRLSGLAVQAGSPPK
jgi:hypothetical protein